MPRLVLCVGCEGSVVGQRPGVAVVECGGRGGGSVGLFVGGELRVLVRWWWCWRLVVSERRGLVDVAVRVVASLITGRLGALHILHGRRDWLARHTADFATTCRAQSGLMEQAPAYAFKCRCLHHYCISDQGFVKRMHRAQENKLNKVMS